MKIVILNTSERSGGAAIAANRLMKVLRSKGADAIMLVRDKQTDDPNVISVNTSFFITWLNKFRFIWERLIIFIYNNFKRKTLFKVSIANAGFDVTNMEEIKNADIIHLHWINQGFLSLKDIQKLIDLRKPIVWTLHDMWPCTGICHHAYSCDRYTNKCGCCYFMDSNNKRDLSYKIWKKKQFFNSSDINVVAVSTWLKNVVHRSSLMNTLQTLVIPNVIDTGVFKPYDKSESRQMLSLPQEKKILLMGAACLDDEIKGAIYLKNALKLLSEKNDLILVLFGNVKNRKMFFKDIAVPYVYMEVIQDMNKIARLYSAADITITPSLFETFGQTISESMACGCPAVSFNNSGQTDIIDHKINGYLAKYKDSPDMACGIEWILNESDYESLSINARNKVVSNFSEEVVAKQYVELYKTLLS